MQRQRHVGGWERAAVVGWGRGVDVWMGMKKKKKDKSGERELEERCGEIRGRNRDRNVNGKFSLVPRWEACTTATL